MYAAAFACSAMLPVTEPSLGTVLAVAVTVQVLLLVPSARTTLAPQVVAERGLAAKVVSPTLMPPTGAGTFDEMVHTDSCPAESTSVAGVQAMDTVGRSSFCTTMLALVGGSSS